MQRIGVFVCWCGSNIAATVDVETVSQALAKEPGVVFSTNYQYMCSQTALWIQEHCSRMFAISTI